jgi:MFS family permease
VRPSNQPDDPLSRVALHNNSKAFPVPSLIKRNTVLIALSQSFTGCGMPMAYGLVPLMVMALTHSATWAGLAVGLIGLSRFLIAYPIGKITDSYGRKPGIQLGLILALTGGVIVGLAMLLHSFPMLFAGLLVFGMGMNATQQLRVAAADMFLPARRAQALGYAAMGSLVGVASSPLLIQAGVAVGERFGQDPLGITWLLLPIVIAPGMILVALVRPDPKEIGLHLDRYYPGYTPPARPAAADATRFSAMSLLRHVPTRLAIVSNCAAQANMSIVMVLTSLVLDHHGHSLSAISASMALHAIGMFAFSIPIGKLADRFGRSRVMFPGVAATLVGASLVAFTDGWGSVTLGTFIVGIGWAAANISATATIADYAETAQRGRAIGVNDSFAGGGSVLVAVVTGPMIQWFGLAAAGLAAVLMSLVPLVMALAARIGQGRPARERA